MTKVLVLDGDSSLAVVTMFRVRGYDVILDEDVHPKDVDLVCFTGGADVSPYIYGEESSGAVGCDPIRDEYEKELFEIYRDVPKVGICRGGQLLNVLSGGKMIQDLGLISGDVRDNWDRELRVDHHQGMLAEIVDGLGGTRLLSWYETEEGQFVDEWPDYVIFYKDTKSLCFQPHPEWGHKGTEDYFFELIRDYLGL